MCATVAEIINGKLMMTEDWNGVTLYAHNHFMVGIKKTSATVYCIWSSICNKYVCEEERPLLNGVDFWGGWINRKRLTIGLYYEKFIFHTSIWYKAINRINNTAIMPFQEIFSLDALIHCT